MNRMNKIEDFILCKCFIISKEYPILIISKFIYWIENVIHNTLFSF